MLLFFPYPTSPHMLRSLPPNPERGRRSNAPLSHLIFVFSLSLPLLHSTNQRCCSSPLQVAKSWPRALSPGPQMWIWISLDLSCIYFPPCWWLPPLLLSTMVSMALSIAILLVTAPYIIGAAYPSEFPIINFPMRSVLMWIRCSSHYWL